MEIGLYNLKYPARKLINGALPLVRDVNPNTVSWLLVPVGVLSAVAIYAGLTLSPWFFLAATLLTLLRMFLGTLDGLMAERFGKSSARGTVLNRLTPEICDVLYLLAFPLADEGLLLLGLIAVGVAWLTSFAGLLALSIGAPIQSVGPVGQTDRLAALLIMLLGASLAPFWGVNIDWARLFLTWVIVGGAVTVHLRISRALRFAEGV